MRTGRNPGKAECELPSYGRHRVIVSVYVPEISDYYKELPEIVNICLESLVRTVGTAVAVTVIDNGCCGVVRDMLIRIAGEGRIDQFIINTNTRGKIDAVLSAARGSYEDFITLSDCDAFFLPTWLQKIEGIFTAFPECGFASPFPVPDWFYYTRSTIVSAFLNSELRIGKVVSDEDLTRIYESLDRTLPESQKRKQLYVERNGVRAVVGASHFVCTLRREAIRALPDSACNISIGNNSEGDWLDAPIDHAAFWRLTTAGMYVYHMGNRLSGYARELVDGYRAQIASQSSTDRSPMSLYRRDIVSRLPYFARYQLSRLIIKTQRRKLQ